MIYLDKIELQEKYSFLNSHVEKEFYKLETLPEYNDYGIEDWNSVSSSEMRNLIIKAQNEIYSNYHQIIGEQIAKGVKLKRVRYISFPLSSIF